MKKELQEKILLIASISFTVAAIIFLIVNTILKPTNNVYLIACVVCIILSNLFNIVRLKK